MTKETTYNYIDNNLKNKYNLSIRDIQVALDEFHKKYPIFFECGSLQMFTRIYYPIALLELEILECASEEFETIEHSVLELYYAGLRNAQDICEVLGLPPKYVKCILNILEGYKHIIIEKEVVTSLGTESIDKGIKITEYTTRQKVQADTLTGLLLTKEIYQSKNMLLATEETDSRVFHVIPNAFISNSILEKNIKEFKNMRNGIFNINVKQIEGIVSKEFKFTYAFLVKFEHLPHPFVIIKCREYSKVEGKMIYYWKPLAISRSTLDNLLITTIDGIAVVDDHLLSPLEVLVNDVTQHTSYRISELKSSQAKLDEWLKKNLSLLGMLESKIRYSFNNLVLNIWIDSDSLMLNSKESILSLKYLSQGVHKLPYIGFVRYSSLEGIVCYLHTDDQTLINLSKKVKVIRKIIDKVHKKEDLSEEVINETANKIGIEISVDEAMELFEVLKYSK